MSLAAGTRLGSYEIVSLLGVGGMGEVYRARDSKLNRDVALKVLPSIVAGEPDRLMRFRREAQVLASLNHPNIAHIHGFEDSANVHALVMELVEGPTLADRIAQGPIPLDDAIPIARQIADALEAAHEQGIVHRDLKPANIKVRDDGAVKVLDFGLAKALDSSPGGTDAMNSPTLTARATQLGVILGTAAYMAPEQARGKAVDRRADIWAFGVVLYEMLTGRRAFEGDDISITLASVLKEDVNWQSLPPNLPAPIRRLLRRCFEKDPKRRLSAIGDARLELEEAAAPGVADAPPPAVAPPRSPNRLVWAAVSLLVIGFLASTAIAVMHLREGAPVREPVQFTIASPENSLFFGSSPQFALSPDGRQVVFVASAPSVQSASLLWVRPLASVTAHTLPGTEQASYPFWSADSRFIGFFANGKLKKVPVSGAPPFALCDASAGRGGTWNENNEIVFSPSPGSVLFRIGAAGGTPVKITTLAPGETSHRFPFFLPDGRHFLFFSGNPGQVGTVRVGSLDGSTSAWTSTVESNVEYANGSVFFVRSGNLLAQPFDPDRRNATGDPIPVLDQIGVDSAAYSAFSLSTTATLSYVRGSSRPTARLTWFDRSGKPAGTAGDPGEYFNVALSPDERHVATSLQTGATPNRDIWTIDLGRAGAPSRFTFDPAADANPIWSPDQSQIAFTSNRTGPYNIYIKSASGTSQEALVVKADTPNYVADWSRDGRFLSYSNVSGGTGLDLWVVPLVGERKPQPYLQTPFNEDDPVFSPNGQWIAYDSNEGGVTEVFIRPFPAGPGQYQVSRGGGTQPQWRGDGKELYFLAQDGTLMAAGIDTTTATMQVSVPKPLFSTGALLSGNRRQYGVTKDGQRFLVSVPERKSSPAPITVVTNWPSTIK